MTEVSSSEAVFSRSTATRRFNMPLMSIFAALALVIAATGIYGVISFLVVQRRRETGVRMALGANPRDVVRLFVGRGTATVLLGVGAGLAGAWWLAETLRSNLRTKIQDLTPACSALRPAATYSGRLRSRPKATSIAPRHAARYRATRSASSFRLPV